MRRRQSKEKKERNGNPKVERVITKTKQGMKNIRNRTVGLGKKYILKSKQSLRHEILNMILLAGALAMGICILTTLLAQGIGIGRYTHTNYKYSRDGMIDSLVSAAKELNTLDYMDISYEISPERVREYLEERSYESEREATTTEPKDETQAIETEGPQEETIEVNYEKHVERSKEAMIGFQTELDQGIVGRYNGNSYYNNGQEIYEVDPLAEELYNTFAKMIEEDAWNEGQVYQKLEAYYKERSSKVIVKDSAVEEILSNLNAMSYGVRETKTYLLNGQGDVLYNQGIVKTIDIVQAIKNTSTGSNHYDGEYQTSMYPVILNGEVHYLYNETMLEGEYYTSYTSAPAFLGVLVGVLSFVFLVFKLTAARIRYIEYLSECLGEISKGNLDYVVEIRGEDELAKLGKDMSYMEMQLKKQIEERMQSERTKNELVTNVAHDLRTPLTSIIGYMGLVKDGKYEDGEECKRYLDIAYSKSERLKVLIEDLFEYTKLSNRVIELKQEHISTTLLMNQLIEELRPQAEEKNIRMTIHALAGESGVYVDILKMARVFENLLENAIKYSKEDEVIQVIIQAKNGYVYTSVRNRCASTPEGDITKLFDRFYRTDTSRNSTTGGSGLGLAIAKNIVEMHEGKIWAQLDDDRISFNVKLKQM